MIKLYENFEIYDDRNKCYITLKSKDCNIIFYDSNVCLVKYEENYILFNLNSGKVLTENFMFWIVKNENN